MRSERQILVMHDLRFSRVRSTIIYGSLGRNGHSLKHHKTAGHSVSVKSGTIIPESNAEDIHFYDAEQDPELAAHLSTFRVNIQKKTKTVKSMIELQLEHKLSCDFSLTSEDGTSPSNPYSGPVSPVPKSRQLLLYGLLQTRLRSGPGENVREGVTWAAFGIPDV